MIIDASVAFKWVVEEEGSEAAIALIGSGDLIGPTLIHAEVGNALWKAVRRGELAGDGEISEQLADLARYLRTVDETPLLGRALALGIELGHPVYDCVYLALAEDLDDMLVTADRRFVCAVAGTSHERRVKELIG
jgi:predicted nucleic acid-binding protein